ncbi:MAG: hypothetical protein ABI746_11575, partial [Dermatophilaceae bacterium]
MANARRPGAWSAGRSATSSRDAIGQDLNAMVRALVNDWSDRWHPFVWIKTADELHEKAGGQTISRTDRRHSLRKVD